MSFSQRQGWFKQNSGSMPEMTSHSPKENHSSTSSTQFVPCWVLTTSPVLDHTLHWSLAHLQTGRDSPVPGFGSTALTCKAFTGPESTTGSSHDVEEIQNRDIPSPAPFSFTKIAAVPQFLCCCDSYPIEDGILQPSHSASMGELPPRRQRHTHGKGWEAWHGIPSVLAINKIQLQQKGGWSPKCPAVTLDLLIWVVCTCHQFHEATAKLCSTVCPLPCSPA